MIKEVMVNEYVLAPLPPSHELETQAVLRKAASAHRYLAELKGASALIPNQGILIDTLALQEAKDSSAIENIVTTHDELFRSDLSQTSALPAVKEVRQYAAALRTGFERVKRRRLLVTSDVVDIQRELVLNSAGLRRLPGTVLKNEQSGDVVYVPPQDYATIISLLDNLERYINDDTLAPVDPLVRMAVIHYQFESIHPFPDGNGRTGRILNVLYLVLKGLLDVPALYLSRYIIHNKARYYDLLAKVRTDGTWEEWVLYMLDGVEKTSRQTIWIIKGMRELMMDYKQRIRSSFKFYSQDLVNNLFRYPYTKIEFVQRDLKVSRITATKYLDALADAGLVQKQKLGRSSYYINRPLFTLLTNIPDSID
jgi:Fic family protein